MKARIVRINDESEAIQEIKNTGADKSSLQFMSRKSLFRTVRLEDIDNRAANLIKQECLSLGCDASVNWRVCGFNKGLSNVLLMGTEKQLNLLVTKLERQPFELKNTAKVIKSVIANYKLENFKAGCLNISLKTPLVMGILNVTPDSFSDGNKYYDTQTALEHGLAMADSGAGIIDVGGESTKPGSEPVSVKEELKRVIPIIKLLSKKIKIPVSIDTCKAEVARAALDAGAKLVNDITGLRHNNGQMAKVVSKYKVPVVIMHMQGTPKNMQKNPVYGDVVSEIIDFFSERMMFAKNNGIKESDMILDPGIGFGKTLKHNLEILKRLKEFSCLGRPILVGTSLKSFIGSVLDGVFPEERLSGSLASFVWAAQNGAGILRVHNVKETVQVLKVLKAIRYNN